VKPFVVAAAQTRSIRGDVEAHVHRHVDAARLAVREEVDLIVFPELSLTGYEPDLAAGLTLTPDDPRLRPLSELAREHALTIVAGAPLSSGGDRPHIGAVAFTPAASLVYAKRFLHASEERFFAPGAGPVVLEVGDVRVGLAICADIAQAAHPRDVAELGATVYAVGILVTAAGYAADTQLLQTYAARHRMAVVMANHSAATGGWEPAGRSAVWDETGQLVAAVDGTAEALVIAAGRDEAWSGRVVPL
jgi:predicted amidohydrolase